MSKEELKLEKDLCRCCHTHFEGDFKSLYAPYYFLANEKVVYSEMLQECFNIELMPALASYHMHCGICNICIQKLHDALLFKRQVEKCDKQFRDVYMEHIASATFEVPIKEEIIDLGDVNEGKVNFSSLSGMIKENFDNSKLFDDERVADDDDNERMVNDDAVNSDQGADCKLNDEEDRAPPQSKTGPYKKKKGATSKVKKKNKPRTKTVAPPKDKDVENTNTGVIDVVKRVKKQRHPIRKGIDYKQVGDAYQCCKCKKEFNTIKDTRAHIATIHLQMPKYSCTECSKNFFTLAPHNKHKLEEHNIDHRYKCNACERVYNSKAPLEKHINSFHMLGVKYKCNVCNYESFCTAALYRHTFKHKTVKDFHCKYCKKSFLRKTTLNFHERIHTGDKRKVCNVCGQAFVQKASLNYHMAKYHPGEKF